MSISLSPETVKGEGSDKFLRSYATAFRKTSTFDLTQDDFTAQQKNLFPAQQQKTWRLVQIMVQIKSGMHWIRQHSFIYARDK